MNTSNIVIVGLVSGVITVGVAYFILEKLVDFQWWWLIALFGAQFLSVILVAYVLEQKFGYGVKAAAPASSQTVDWSGLRKTTADVPLKVIPQVVPVNDNGAVNSSDWQDLLRQLDQMSKAPAVAAVAVKAPVSVATVCPPVTPIFVQPALPPAASTFDFSTITNALATLPQAAIVSDRVQTTAKTAVISSTPIPPQAQTAQITQGIDFASLFR